MEKILEYQKIDGELRRIKRDLEKNEVRMRGKKLNAMRQEMEDTVVKLEAKASELKTTLAGLDKLSEDISASIEEYQHAVKDIEDIDELNYLKKKIATQSDALANAERDCKNIIRDCDEISKKYAEVSGKLPRIVSEYAKCNEEFTKVTAEVEPQIRELRKKQNDLEKQLDGDKYLELYKKVRSQNIYPVFVGLMEPSRCGGCRMDISGASLGRLAEKGFTRCEHCGRIICKQK
ncbi:MAG: C4-type zinc ribbon domain-containing protein [Corallococcus sp.]|nr:C4-type zinc ribbon domain-containing protein [Corallococcus sp.]